MLAAVRNSTPPDALMTTASIPRVEAMEHHIDAFYERVMSFSRVTDLCL
ncbi:hypothetical protein [Actinomadura geliboluensis]|nr:hypothetical protein [Actinomadura geliboluensis]